MKSGMGPGPSDDGVADQSRAMREVPRRTAGSDIPASDGARPAVRHARGLDCYR